LFQKSDELFSEPAGDLLRLVRHKYDKLISPYPVGILLAKPVSYFPGYSLKHHVASLMSFCVVQLMQSIDINIDACQRMFIAPLYFGQVFLIFVPVVQSCQRIPFSILPDSVKRIQILTEHTEAEFYTLQERGICLVS